MSASKLSERVKGGPRWKEWNRESVIDGTGTRNAGI